MAKAAKCKCGTDMTFVARESDYGDTTSIVSWCPDCGRLLIDDCCPVAGDPDKKSEEKWFEPVRPAVQCPKCKNILSGEFR